VSLICDGMSRERRLGQLGFFDADKRLAALSAKGDPLEAIDRLVPWEGFRADIEAVVLTPDEMRKSSAGRKPFDAIVLFRMLVLQALNNLSDEQVEYQVGDRLSFTRFLRLGIEDRIPDGTTLWLFREKLAKAGLIEKLFDRFDQHLGAQGYIARGGQIIDATIVAVPRQRNTREENEAIKIGRTLPPPPGRDGRPCPRSNPDSGAPAPNERRLGRQFPCLSFPAWLWLLLSLVANFVACLTRDRRKSRRSSPTDSHRRHAA
jgi:IS5 family transposase